MEATFSQRTAAMRAAIGDGVKFSPNIEEGQFLPFDMNQHPLTGGEVTDFSYLDSLAHT
jgi:hypothetical protein